MSDTICQRNLERNGHNDGRFKLDHSTYKVIADIATQGAVHVAVRAEMFWDVIERLREMGASEILVTPIESMIM